MSSSMFSLRPEAMEFTPSGGGTSVTSIPPPTVTPSSPSDGPQHTSASSGSAATPSSPLGSKGIDEINNNNIQNSSSQRGARSNHWSPTTQTRLNPDAPEFVPIASPGGFSSAPLLPGSYSGVVTAAPIPTAQGPPYGPRMGSPNGSHPSIRPTRQPYPYMPADDGSQADYYRPQVGGHMQHHHHNHGSFDSSHPPHSHHANNSRSSTHDAAPAPSLQNQSSYSSSNKMYHHHSHSHPHGHHPDASERYPASSSSFPDNQPNKQGSITRAPTQPPATDGSAAPPSSQMSADAPAFSVAYTPPIMPPRIPAGSGDMTTIVPPARFQTGVYPRYPSSPFHEAVYSQMYIPGAPPMMHQAPHLMTTSSGQPLQPSTQMLSGQAAEKSHLPQPPSGSQPQQPHPSSHHRQHRLPSSTSQHDTSSNAGSIVASSEPSQSQGNACTGSNDKMAVHQDATNGTSEQPFIQAASQAARTSFHQQHRSSQQQGTYSSGVRGGYQAGRGRGRGGAPSGGPVGRTYSQRGPSTGQPPNPSTRRMSSGGGGSIDRIPRTEQKADSMTDQQQRSVASKEGPAQPSAHSPPSTIATPMNNTSSQTTATTALQTTFAAPAQTAAPSWAERLKQTSEKSSKTTPIPPVAIGSVSSSANSSVSAGPSSAASQARQNIRQQRKPQHQHQLKEKSTEKDVLPTNTRTSNNEGRVVNGVLPSSAEETKLSRNTRQDYQRHRIEESQFPRQNSIASDRKVRNKDILSEPAPPSGAIPKSTSPATPSSTASSSAPTTNTSWAAIASKGKPVVSATICTIASQAPTNAESSSTGVGSVKPPLVPQATQVALVSSVATQQPHSVQIPAPIPATSPVTTSPPTIRTGVASESPTARRKIGNAPLPASRPIPPVSFGNFGPDSEASLASTISATPAPLPCHTVTDSEKIEPKGEVQGKSVVEKTNSESRQQQKESNVQQQQQQSEYEEIEEVSAAREIEILKERREEKSEAVQQPISESSSEGNVVVEKEQEIVLLDEAEQFLAEHTYSPVAAVASPTIEEEQHEIPPVAVERESPLVITEIDTSTSAEKDKPEPTKEESDEEESESIESEDEIIVTTTTSDMMSDDEVEVEIDQPPRPRGKPIQIPESKIYPISLLIQIRNGIFSDGVYSPKEPEEAYPLPWLLSRKPESSAMVNLRSAMRIPDDIRKKPDSLSTSIEEVWRPNRISGSPSTGRNALSKVLQTSVRGGSGRHGGRSQLERTGSSRDEKPSEDAWRRPLAQPAEGSRLHRAKNITDHSEILSRKLMSILNKLTIEKFDSLYDQIKNAGMEGEDDVRILMEMICGKAKMQHHFIAMYVRLCSMLQEDLTHMKIIESGGQGFRRLLVDACQQSFEETLQPIKVPEGISEEEAFEFTLLEKKKMKGNMIFVAELHKKKMIAAKVLMGCVDVLLANAGEPQLEALCELLVTSGKQLQSAQKFRARLEQSLGRIKDLIQSEKLSTRIRFLLQDVVDDWRAGWVKASREREGPKKLDQIHQQVASEDTKGKSNLGRTGGSQSFAPSGRFGDDEGFTAVGKRGGKTSSRPFGGREALSRYCTTRGASPMTGRDAGRGSRMEFEEWGRVQFERSIPSVTSSHNGKQRGDSSEPHRQIDTFFADRRPVLAATAIQPISVTSESGRRQTLTHYEPSTTKPFNKDECKAKLESLKGSLMDVSPDYTEAVVSLKQTLGTMTNVDMPYLISHTIFLIADSRQTEQPVLAKWLMHWKSEDLVSSSTLENGVREFLAYRYVSTKPDCPKLAEVMINILLKEARESGVLPDKIIKSLEDEVKNVDSQACDAF